jgi:hypothetical protein
VHTTLPQSLDVLPCDFLPRVGSMVSLAIKYTVSQPTGPHIPGATCMCSSLGPPNCEHTSWVTRMQATPLALTLLILRWLEEGALLEAHAQRTADDMLAVLRFQRGCKRLIHVVMPCTNHAPQ